MATDFHKFRHRRYQRYYAPIPSRSTLYTSFRYVTVASTRRNAATTGRIGIARIQCHTQSFSDLQKIAFGDNLAVPDFLQQWSPSFRVEPCYPTKLTIEQTDTRLHHHT